MSNLGRRHHDGKREIDIKLFEPLSNYLEKTEASVENVKLFINTLGVRPNLGDKSGFLFEAYIKTLLLGFPQKTGINLFPYSFFRQKYDYNPFTYKIDNWGNIKITRAGKDFTEVDGLYEFKENGEKKLVIFEMKKLNEKDTCRMEKIDSILRFMRGENMTQDLYYCKIRGAYNTFGLKRSGFRRRSIRLKGNKIERIIKEISTPPTYH